LRAGWQSPTEVTSSRVPSVKRPAYLVDLDAAPDKAAIKKIRRSDKLSKMAVLAAAEALKDGGKGEGTPSNLGVIVATGFGAHVTTFAFLDDILEYGDAAVSPTTFSNSVHNAAASYVSSALNIKGPTLTVTQFRFSFQSALQLAMTWIDQKRCEQVLVGAVDQYGDVLGYVSDQKLTTAKDGRIKPFLFKPTCHVLGEGAAFFLVSKGHSERSYCTVHRIRINDGDLPGNAVDLNIIDADGLFADESAYQQALSAGVPTAAYSPLFGSMMIGSAFNVAAGAVMLRRQTVYATPVQDNPHGIRLATASGSSRISSIRCIGYDCSGIASMIDLSRT
jgi:3-oxoacyl-[acyl-carrier-protein] synthase II